MDIPRHFDQVFLQCEPPLLYLPRCPFPILEIPFNLKSPLRFFIAIETVEFLFSGFRVDHSRDNAAWPLYSFQSTRRIVDNANIPGIDRHALRQSSWACHAKKDWAIASKKGRWTHYQSTEASKSHARQIYSCICDAHRYMVHQPGDTSCGKCAAEPAQTITDIDLGRYPTYSIVSQFIRSQSDNQRIRVYSMG
jgi:hypothetical protein